MKAIIFSLLFALGILPLSVLAGEQSGTVMDIRVTSFSNGGGSHVNINGTYNTLYPNCSSGGVWWAFDSDTSTGKAMLATLLTAKVTGKTVILWGDGSCLRDGMEKLVQVSIQL